MSAMDRAILKVIEAAGDRPFVILTERTHRKANCSSLGVTCNDGMRVWEVLGMLRQATLRQERWLAQQSARQDEEGSAP